MSNIEHDNNSTSLGSSLSNSSIFIPDINISTIFNQQRLPPNLLNTQMQNKFKALKLSLGIKSSKKFENLDGLDEKGRKSKQEKEKGKKKSRIFFFNLFSKNIIREIKH
jgi:hypothetical protein